MITTLHLIKNHDKIETIECMLIVIEVLEKNFAHDENVSRDTFDIIYSGLEKYYCELKEMLINERKIGNIKELPSVTPKAKVGKWIADVDRWGDIITTVNGYRCSECNTFDTDKDNYCPMCGAKMEVKHEH